MATSKGWEERRSQGRAPAEGGALRRRRRYERVESGRPTVGAGFPKGVSGGDGRPARRPYGPVSGPLAQGRRVSDVTALD